MAQPIFLFDYDGTLADSLVVFERATVASLVAMGFPPLADREAFLRLLDGNLSVALGEMGLSRAQVLELFERLTPLVAGDQANTPIFPGVAEMLRELSQRALVAVVTSNVGAVVRPKLAEAGLLAYVEDVVGSDVEPSKVRKIQSFQARVPAGTPVYYVGDTLGDMIEGRAAGAVTVAVSWGWHTPERMQSAAPDVIARYPQDILALVAEDQTVDSGAL